MPFGSLLVPAAVIILVVVLFFLTLRGITRLYVKVPPNKAAVFYGRKSRSADGKVLGAKILSGGGKIRVPILEEVSWLDLGAIQIELDAKDIPNVNGVPVSVKGVATVKIRSDETGLSSAAERFLGKRPEEIKQIVYENLLGHLRAIIGRMQVEELIRDRQRFNDEVLKEAGEDLAKMGIGVDTLKIQDIKDPLGYIEALARPRTTEIQRDAQIASAVNKSTGDQQAAVANQQGRMAEATAEAEIAQAQRDRDVRKQSYVAQVNSETAKAAQAGPLATAEAQQKVVEQQTLLAEREAQRKESELKATVIKPAEAAKEQRIIEAEAQRQQVILQAEADKERVVLQAQASKSLQELEGQGEAEKIRAIGLAKADAVRAEGLARAEAISAQAKAMKELNEAGQQLSILDKLPAIIKELEPVARAMAEPLGNIKEVKILDLGGDGQGAAKFAGNTVGLLTALAEALKSTGVLGALTDALKTNAPEERKAPTATATKAE